MAGAGARTHPLPPLPLGNPAAGHVPAAAAAAVVEPRRPLPTSGGVT